MAHVDNGLAHFYKSESIALIRQRLTIQSRPYPFGAVPGYWHPRGRDYHTVAWCVFAGVLGPRFQYGGVTRLPEYTSELKVA